MGKNKILGYYKRIRDNSEFICYEESGRVCLTNGVFIWRDRVKEKYLPQCKKVNEIDLNRIVRNLKQYYPHHFVLKVIAEKDK